MPQTEDKKAKKALDAVLYLEDYLDTECESVCDIWWKDKLGYTFEGDMGYIFSGLESIENYLIKRLRKARIEDDDKLSRM